MVSSKRDGSEDSKESNRGFVMGPTPAYEQEETDDTRSARGPQDSPAQQSGLNRGVQIPSRTSYVTSGFRLPPSVKQAGVARAKWSAFTEDIRQHASLSLSQWGEITGSGFSILVVGGLFISWFAIIPASFVGHHLRRHREQQNMHRAYHYGTLNLCLNEWNKLYFIPRGLIVAVNLPGQDHGLMQMDLSVPKRLKRHKMDRHISAAPVTAKDAGNRKQSREYIKASAKRSKAMRKCRIVVLPLSQTLSPLGQTLLPLGQTLLPLGQTLSPLGQTLPIESSSDVSATRKMSLPTEIEIPLGEQYRIAQGLRLSDDF